MLRRYICLFIILAFISERSYSQGNTGFFEASPQFNKGRFVAVVGTEALLLTATSIGLQSLWYKKYHYQKFHFFNDNGEWLQMDKVGHMFTSYVVGRAGAGLLNWSGVPRSQSIWFGGTLGLAFLTSVEMRDAYSEAWGFSWGDMAANALGSSLYIGQELTWGEQRMSIMFSYHRTIYPAYRPNLLGNNLLENIIKDYNGQTYWLALNPAAFAGNDHFFPNWLDITLGYGAEGMTGGHMNPEYDAEGKPMPHFERYRQYYLSLTPDLARVIDPPSYYKIYYDPIQVAKVPFPALEFSQYHFSGHWLYH